MDTSVLDTQKANYQTQLDANRKQAADLQSQMQNNAAQYEQLRGAIFALDQVLAAVAPAPAPAAASTDAAPADVAATPAAAGAS